MKKLLCVSEAVIDIKDAAEVKEEISRFGEWVEDLIPRLLDLVLEIAFAFVIIIIGMKLIKWVRKLLKKSLERQAADTGLIQFLDSLVKYGLYILLGLSILQRFGVQTTSIVAAMLLFTTASGASMP